MDPKDMLYSKTHEWISVENGIATIGITDHAQQQLGDITFVEVNEVGGEYEKEESIGTIESVKAVSDIYAPISGEITEVNEELENEPERVNQDPYEKGWILKMKLGNEEELKELMDFTTYEKFSEEESD